MSAAQPATSASGLAQVALPASGASTRTCHAVCTRELVSTPTAISTSSGRSMCVTSRCHTSR
jgi:hypothetical protein